MKSLINTFKNKFGLIDNFPLILFGITMVNFIPILITNYTKGPGGIIDTRVKILLLLIEYAILAIFYIINHKKIKINFKKLVLLCIVSFVLFTVQIANYLMHDLFFFDLFNIGIFFVNVLMFYLLLYDFKITEKGIIKFHKLMVYFALISTLWMFIIFFKEILAEIGIIYYNYDYSALNNIKGFFTNRAALSFVILLAIISNSILIKYSESKRYYKYFYIIFFIGIWATHSKTEYLLMSCLFLTLIIINEKYNTTKKICLSLLVTIICGIGFINVLGYFPNIEGTIGNVLKDQQINNINDSTFIPSSLI